MSSLTQALRAGEPGVFGVLYDAHARALYAYCRTMVGDEAGDAVRDAFIAAARHPGTAPDDEVLPVWLFALARAECLRRGALLRKSTAEPGAEPMRRALARLRPEHREVLALSANLELVDLARVTGLATDTAEQMVRMARRRLDQAAASVLAARGVHDDDMVAALGVGRLHKLVGRSDEPPARLRNLVLFSCAAAERAVDGALLFDKDGLPIQLDGVADAVTHPLTKVTAEMGRAPDTVRPDDPRPVPATATVPARTSDGGTSAERPARKKVPFLVRRHDGLVEILGLAACVAVATGVVALWPSPHDKGASDMDGTSLLLHRGSPVTRLLQTPASASPQETTTHGAGIAPSATPSSPAATGTTSPSGSATPGPGASSRSASAPGTAAPASTHPGHPGNPGHSGSPTSAPSTPPAPTSTPTPPVDPTPGATPTPTDSAPDANTSPDAS